jgi:hypothetical protein
VPRGVVPIRREATYTISIICPVETDFTTKCDTVLPDQDCCTGVEVKTFREKGKSYITLFVTFKSYFIYDRERIYYLIYDGGKLYYLIYDGKKLYYFIHD